MSAAEAELESLREVKFEVRHRFHCANTEVSLRELNTTNLTDHTGWSISADFKCQRV